MPAGVTRLHVPSKRRGAAGDQRPDDMRLLRRKPSLLLPVGVLEAP